MIKYAWQIGELFIYSMIYADNHNGYEIWNVETFHPTTGWPIEIENFRTLMIKEFLEREKRR